VVGSWWKKKGKEEKNLPQCVQTKLFFCLLWASENSEGGETGRPKTLG
jgi:hypothetical protein